jgi:hypothetical protein
MGTRGPVPKRSDQRHRNNKPEVEVEKLVVDDSHVIDAPAGDVEWHPVAAQWYESLSASGQARFYEPSDWTFAYLMAESMSRDLKPQFVGFKSISQGVTEAEYAVIPLKGASLGAYLRAMSSLLATEGDRRRAALELQRASTAADPGQEHADATVTALRVALAGG